MINEPSLIDFLMDSLILMDKSLEKSDVNAALKKVHECIAKIKEHKETKKFHTCEHSGITFEVKD